MATSPKFDAKFFFDEFGNQDNPMRLPRPLWAALDEMTREQVRRSEAHWHNTDFRQFIFQRAERAYMEQMRRRHESPFAIEEAMKAMRPPPIHLPTLPETKTETIKSKGIVMEYVEDYKTDECVVTMRIPYNLVKGMEIPKEVRELFVELMKSKRISDQLLGLEALVRYEENRKEDE